MCAIYKTLTRDTQSLFTKQCYSTHTSKVE